MNAREEIIKSVISAIVGGVIMFIGASALGLFEKTASDSQLKKISRVIVDTPDLREVIVNKMNESGNFLGPQGDRGDQGVRGESGKIIDKLPIGSIIAWHKSLDGDVKLSDEWVEANGQQVDDEGSPYHNLVMPDLNTELYSKGRGRYLRGGLVSGVLNESSYYTDNGVAYKSGGYGPYYGAVHGAFNEIDRDSNTAPSFSTGRLGSVIRFETAAMTVVWIIKVR